MKALSAGELGTLTRDNIVLVALWSRDFFKPHLACLINLLFFFIAQIGLLVSRRRNELVRVI